MNQVTKWLLLICGCLVVFGLFVWAADALLPWDRPERIGTGAGAGAVVAGVLVAWATSVIGAASLNRSSVAEGNTASGERSVATGDNSGIIITGDNGNVQR
ncbi:hypothetical protein [Streptomyces longwoodensis]|uniref:hypothetical protein n=1 Tax=Streptomyces longwoodensis TaxID=68231 RepID=UPI003405916B